MSSSSESIRFKGGGTEWGKMLEESASSLQTGRHKYIISGDARVSENKKGAASLEAITYLSYCLLSENYKTLQEIGLAKERNPDSYTPAVQQLENRCVAENIKIFDNTEKLINARAEKRKKNVFLNAARIVSCLSSFILIGIPFFILIKNEDVKFGKEIEELRDNLKGITTADKEGDKLLQEIKSSLMPNPQPYKP